MSDEPLTRIGDYQVLGVLGAGGMGKVYKVRNVITERVEAMKVLLPDLAGRRDLAERFLREIKILAGLSHPNIAQLRTALTWENQLVMVMEYVEGVTLSARVKQGSLSVAEAVNYIDQVLAALSYAHGLHIIHRDIKPANMMLTPENVVKLMDFGIARSQTDPVLTATGSTLGSIHYMAPEQLRAQPVDERSDLYSVGVSLYELTTGQRPFHGDSDVAVMAALLQQTPEPPITLRQDLPGALNDIIVMAMQRDPAQRFQSADAFRNALKSVSVGAAAANIAASVTSVLPAGLNGGTITSPTPPSFVRAAASGSAAAHVGPSGMHSPPAEQATPEQPSSVVQRLPQAQPQPDLGIVDQLPARPSRHRGLYMALGALVVVIALVAAGLFLPRMKKAHAGIENATVAPPANPLATQPSKPPVADATAPLVTPEQRTGSSEQPTTTSPLLPIIESRGPAAGSAAAASDSVSGKASPPMPRQSAIQGSRGSTGQLLPRTHPQRQEATAMNAAGHAPAAVAKAPGLSVDAEQLQQLEHDLDLLSSRAEAVNASLDGLRQAQAAQGLGLRGDVAASQQRMRTYLGKAQAALNNQDATNARKYANLAETEVASLEKFLGH